MQFCKLFQRIICSAQPTRRDKTSSQRILTKDRIAGAPHEKCPFPWGDPGRAITSLQASSDSSPVSGQPRTTVSVGALHPFSSADTFRQPSSSCRTAFPAQQVRPSGVLGCWPDDLELNPMNSVDCLGVYLKRICSRVTSASSALGVLDDYALYKSTHSLTHLKHSSLGPRESTSLTACRSVQPFQQSSCLCLAERQTYRLRKERENLFAKYLT